MKRKPRKVPIWVALAALIAILISTHGCQGGTREDFFEILEKISDKDVKQEVIQRNYAGRFSKRDIPFLKKQASAPIGPQGRRLAIEILGRIGGKDAADALTEVTIDTTPPDAVNAVLSIENTKVPDLKERFERIATTIGPEHIMMAGCVGLRWVGDRETAVKLKEFADAIESPLLKTFLMQSARAIEFRLDQLPQHIGKDEWKKYEKQFWSNVMDPVPSRGLSIRNLNTARKISAEGRLPLVFLQRIGDQEWFAAHAIALYVIGIQKETDTIPGLIRKVKMREGTEIGNAAVFALSEISNEQSTEALGDLLASEEIKNKKAIVRALAKIGTRQAAGILLELSRTEKKRDLADYYKRSAEIILKRGQ